jgi:alanyl-tRNA synthetase
MKTERLYYSDSYIKEFDAIVVSCEKLEKGYKVVLDKTAFFPEGGGQKADTGFIGESKVTDVQESDDVIYHFVDKELNASTEYNCKLDWEQSFLRMQSHSGEHIVSGVVHSLYGYDNVGFHMEEDYVTVDFSGELTREQLDEVEEKTNRYIYDNIEIECFFPSEDEIENLDYRSKLDLKEGVRLVRIGEADLCACCAPHVKRTGEIGVVKILDFMRHRGGVRIVMKSGLKAVFDYREKYTSVYDVSVMLSSKQHEIASYVDKKIKENETLQRSFINFKMQIAENDKENLSYIGDTALFITSFYDSDMMRELANYGMTQKELCVILSGNEENGFSYVAGSLNFDLMRFAKHFNSALNGRGGGRGTMIQGKVTATKQDIINYFNSLDLKSI